MAKKSVEDNELLKRLKGAVDQANLADKPAAGLLITGNTSPKSGRAAKITATIYPTDWARLDEIKDFFRSRGVRNLSDSEALRIACRAVHITDDLFSYYEDMKQEDGRQRKTA